MTQPNSSLIVPLWPAALGIALMSFTETIAAGRAFAESDEPTPQANRELMATGAANAAGASPGIDAAGGGTTQTAVNRLAGARTQLAGLIAAGAALVTMLLLAPFIGLMPEATLAAVVIVYSIGLIKPAEFRTILEVRRTESYGPGRAGRRGGARDPGGNRGRHRRLASRSPIRWPIRRSMCSVASRARTSSGLVPRIIPRTRHSQGC